MIKKEDINLLAKSLYISISDDELNYLVQELEAYEKKLSELNKVNSNNFSSMTFPFDSYSKEYQSWKYNNLREDSKCVEKTTKILKDNCINIEDDFVILPKVI